MKNTSQKTFLHRESPKLFVLMKLLPLYCELTSVMLLHCGMTELELLVHKLVLISLPFGER